MTVVEKGGVVCMRIFRQRFLRDAHPRTLRLRVYFHEREGFFIRKRLIECDPPYLFLKGRLMKPQALVRSVVIAAALIVALFSTALAQTDLDSYHKRVKQTVEALDFDRTVIAIKIKKFADVETDQDFSAWAGAFSIYLKEYVQPDLDSFIRVGIPSTVSRLVVDNDGSTIGGVHERVVKTCSILSSLWNQFFVKLDKSSLDNAVDNYGQCFFSLVVLSEITDPAFERPIAPTATPTLTPIGVTTITSTVTPTASLTVTPSATTATTVTVIKSANLRSGPGTTYTIVGGAKKGKSLVIVAQNKDGKWLKIEDGTWIAAFLVNKAPSNLPIE